MRDIRKDGTAQRNDRGNNGAEFPGELRKVELLVPVAKEAVPLEIRAKFGKNLKEINKSNKEIKTQGLQRKKDSYIHNYLFLFERKTGLKPATPSLEG